MNNNNLSLMSEMVPLTKNTYQWTFDEEFIKRAMSKENARYESYGWLVDSDRDLIYTFTIYPNGKDENKKGQFWIEFDLFMRHDKAVEADLAFSVASEKGYKRSISKSFKTSGKMSIMFADHHEHLLNPKYRFFDNGKFKLNIEMKLKSNVLNEVLLHRTSFLSQKLMEDQNVDCWMVGDDGVKLEAHTFIIELFSPIFKAMIEAQDDNDGNDINIDISGFDHEVIKNAIDFCYGHLSMDNLDFDSLLLLYKFADKYKMDDLKKEVHYEMLPKILPENVCKVLNNISECEDLDRMKKVCIDRVKYYCINRMKLHDIDTLHDEIKKEVFDYLIVPECNLQFDIPMGRYLLPSKNDDCNIEICGLLFMLFLVAIAMCAISFAHK